jgi:hypothetical protein
MTSAALQDLSNRIATNTLTASQQGALVAALAGIIPTFPSPDELANSIPSYEESLSREWMAALYAIDTTGGPPLPPVVSNVLGTAPIVVTPAGSVRTVSITPASGAAAGSMSAADFAKLAALAPGDVTAVTASFPLTSSGGATPNLAPSAGFTLTASVANAAALTALASAALPNGAIAFVGVPGAATPSFCAFFSLEPIGALAPDGSTLIAAADGRIWQRVLSGIVAQAALQTAWFVDGSNSTLAASDENSGLTALVPLLHKQEITRRMGPSPQLNATQTVITYLSPDAAGGGDPGIFQPTFNQGATQTHTAPLPAPTFTGTLLAVTAKNVAANQALRSTFTIITGAVAVDMLLVNSTRGNSRAFAQRNVGAGVWQISQPMTPYVLGTSLPANTNVDTWANGDAITGYALISVDLAVFGGFTDGIQAGFNPSMLVYQLAITEPAADTSSAPLSIGGAIFFCIVESVVRRVPDARAIVAPVQEWSNVAIDCSNSPQFDGLAVDILFSGGFIHAPSLVAKGITLQNGIIKQLSSPAILRDTTFQSGGSYSDTAVIHKLAGFSDFSGAGAVANGIGGINCQQGTVLYVFGSAVATFPLALGIKILGSANAYSNLTTAGLTVTHLLALTPANLDAAAGAAGFGGLAYIPGAGGYTGSGATP